MMALTHKPFYPMQSKESREKYSNLLIGAAQSTQMYSDSQKPYLPYRVVERIFCRAFSADDKSRRDVSVDAVKADNGIGIKTFVSGGRLDKYEKIAEFDDTIKYRFDLTNFKNLIKQVSEYRNDRINRTIKLFNLQNTIYHYVVRDVKCMSIFECDLRPIDMDSISFKRSTPGTVKFRDKYFNYSFSLSKHTLYQEFSYSKPFDILRMPATLDKDLLIKAVEELSASVTKPELTLLKKYDYVILPLYSTDTGDVPEKSGLNQWNAGGRKRDFNEIYIPIPRLVHKKNPYFFPPREHKFLLKTQDGEKFSAKVCQDNSKALMTDPNKDLGRWLLRKVLGLHEGDLVTYEHLRIKGADTVIIYKLGDDVYQISLHSFGGYADEYKKGK